MSVVYHIFTCSHDFRWAIPEDLLSKVNGKKLTPVINKDTRQPMTCVGVDYRSEGRNPIAVPVDAALREILKDPSWLSYSLFKYLTLRERESRKVITRPKFAIPAMEIIYDGRDEPAWISSFQSCIHVRDKFNKTLSGDYFIYRGTRGRSSVFAAHSSAARPNPEHYRFVGTVSNARRIPPVAKTPTDIPELIASIKNAAMRKMMRYVIHRPLASRTDLFPIFELAAGDMKGPIWKGCTPSEELAKYIPHSALVKDDV
mgnify:CR=1 FL=1